MSQMLKGQIAIITGAGRGLGKAFALRFAEEGAKLFLPDISLDRVEAVAKEIRAKKGEAVATQTDVSDESAVKTMADKVMELYGRVDILLNNAGVYYGLTYRPWDSWTAKDWDRIFNVNVKGTWFCCKAIAPIMVKQKKGKIINIASGIMKSHASHLLLPYALSKSAVNQLTLSLARALGPSGINVNSIAPGYTNTEASSTLDKDVRESFEHAIAEQCIPRREEPEDLLGIAVFLASKESDFMTGQVVSVDGGV